MPSTLRSPVLALVTVVVATTLGCQDRSKLSAQASAGAAETAEAGEAQAQTESSAVGSGVESTRPPAPPSGAAWLPRGEVLVQRCDDAHPCEHLTQGPGVERCAALELGERDAWRLPTRQEVTAMAKVEGLESRSGYHWTSSVDEVNDSMFWIVDPEGTQPTTVPGDRKPFLIRCVHDG